MPEIKIETPDATEAALGIFMGLYREDRSKQLTSMPARAEAVVGSVVAAAEMGHYLRARYFAVHAIVHLKGFIAAVDAMERP